MNANERIKRLEIQQSQMVDGFQDQIDWCRDQILELLEWVADQETERIRRELKEETEESPLDSSSCIIN